MTVQVVKLISGEQCLAKISTDQDSGCLTLEKPLQFMLTREGPTLAPLNPLLDDSVQSVTVALRHVVYHAQARQELADAYNQQTGGVITPNTSGLVLP